MEAMTTLLFGFLSLTQANLGRRLRKAAVFCFSILHSVSSMQKCSSSCTGLVA